MALVAQGIDLRHIQQARVLRTMGRVATQAALRLDRGMLEDKGSARLRVALGADHVLVGGIAQAVVPKGAVDVMAIAAPDKTFVHLVVERHIEGGLHVGVALKAEHGLCSLQQLLLVRACMNAVAACATHARFGMR